MAVDRTPSGQPDYEPGNHMLRLASQELYGKLTILIAAGMKGGASSGNFIEYETSRNVDPIRRKPITEITSNPTIPKDKAGVPAIGYTIAESSIRTEIGFTHHEAHEFGHYFGLGHTFGPDDFGDTPEDITNGQPLLRLGSVMCGNVRTITINGKRIAPDKLNNESYWGCNLARTHNSFSPLQLGYMTWQLDTYLHRYPLVACQPVGDYDANHVECENQESIDLCQQTSDYLLKKTGTGVSCQSGGRFTRAMATALQYPAFRFVLEKTSTGQTLVKRLAGIPPEKPLTPHAFAAVALALTTGKNLALTMALVNRINELAVLSGQKSQTLAAGFIARDGSISAGDQRILAYLAKQAITQNFISNIPAITAP
jgi:hypothetical protein